jgi:hypothetical protein
MIAGCVDGNPQDPVSERQVRAKGPKGPIGPQEGILRNVAGGVGIPKKMGGESKYLTLMPLDENCKRIVARQDTRASIRWKALQHPVD